LLLALSSLQTINSYFQLIVETVQEFDGDIIKFAGDALFAQWQASPSRTLEGEEMDETSKWQGIDLSKRMEMAVRMAGCCAAKIIDLCSEYPVYENGREIATLDVHCGVGFGEVFGIHVGGCDRMEYMILGDIIGQVAEAEGMADRGEVVASPVVMEILEKPSRSDSRRRSEVIVSKARKFVHHKICGVDPTKEWIVDNSDVNYGALSAWDLPPLRRLQALMSLYVHPVVVADNVACKYQQSNHLKAKAEAELRDVFTVFIMPRIDAKIKGKHEKDRKLLICLNAIILIVNRELARFKGHLRQYIVDDKGKTTVLGFLTEADVLF
jgi:class 3 adenylate cyclase